MRHQLVVLKDPYTNSYIVRRVVGIPNEWVQRKDDGGLIQVPNEHLWLECESNDFRQNDSLSLYGPITRKLVQGTVKRVVWPPWKWDNLEQIENRADL